MMSAIRPSVRRSHRMCFTSPAGDVANRAARFGVRSGMRSVCSLEPPRRRLGNNQVPRYLCLHQSIFNMHPMLVFTQFSELMRL